MHLIDRIGPYLGVASFLALTILALLVFLQAREVRRLREWAGRAPERAAEAAEASAATAEAKGETAATGPDPLLGPAGSWIGRTWHRFVARLTPAYQAVDRRSPVDPRILIAVIVAGIVAAGILTDGFSFGGGSGESSSKTQTTLKPGQTHVAVLNGSQEQGVTGAPGLAEAVLKDVVKPAGYLGGPVADAPKSFPKSTILYASGQAAAGAKLAAAVEGQLGPSPTEPMSSDVQAIAGKAPLVLVVGVDDADFGSG